MTKWAIYLLLALGVLAGCGSGTTNPPVEGKAPEVAKPGTGPEGTPANP